LQTKRTAEAARHEAEFTRATAASNDLRAERDRLLSDMRAKDTCLAETAAAVATAPPPFDAASLAHTVASQLQALLPPPQPARGEHVDTAAVAEAVYARLEALLASSGPTQKARSPVRSQPALSEELDMHAESSDGLFTADELPAVRGGRRGRRAAERQAAVRAVGSLARTLLPVLEDPHEGRQSPESAGVLPQKYSNASPTQGSGDHSEVAVEPHDRRDTVPGGGALSGHRPQAQNAARQQGTRLVSQQAVKPRHSSGKQARDAVPAAAGGRGAKRKRAACPLAGPVAPTAQAVDVSVTATAEGVSGRAKRACRGKPVSYSDAIPRGLVSDILSDPQATLEASPLHQEAPAAMPAAALDAHAVLKGVTDGAGKDDDASPASQRERHTRAASGAKNAAAKRRISAQQPLCSAPGTIRDAAAAAEGSGPKCSTRSMSPSRPSGAHAQADSPADARRPTSQRTHSRAPAATLRDTSAAAASASKNKRLSRTSKVSGPTPLDVVTAETAQAGSVAAEQPATAHLEATSPESANGQSTRARAPRKRSSRSRSGKATGAQAPNAPSVEPHSSAAAPLTLGPTRRTGPQVTSPGKSVHLQHDAVMAANPSATSARPSCTHPRSPEALEQFPLAEASIPSEAPSLHKAVPLAPHQAHAAGDESSGGASENCGSAAVWESPAPVVTTAPRSRGLAPLPVTSSLRNEGGPTAAAGTSKWPGAASSASSEVLRRDPNAAAIVRNPLAAITSEVLEAARAGRTCSNVSWGARLAAAAAERCALLAAIALITFFKIVQ
jgi:hypothetical protein